MDLDTPNAMGVSKRQSLMSMRKQMEKAGVSKDKLAAIDESLAAVVVSSGTEYLIGVFNQLSLRRQTGMNGPLPITFQEIQAYCKVLDVELEPWEVEAVLTMDTAFMDTVAEMQRAQEQGSSINK